MPTLLFTDANACAESLLALVGPAAPEAAVLLHAGATTLLDSLREVLPSLTAVEIASPRFGRLNFDVLELLIVDLPRDYLESSGGRRLMDALGRLADEAP